MRNLPPVLFWQQSALEMPKSWELALAEDSFEIREFTQNSLLAEIQQWNAARPAVLIFAPETASETALALCQRLRQHPLGQRLGVLVLFPREQANQAPKWLQVGADACLVKPMPVELFRSQVQALFRMSERVFEPMASQAEIQSIQQQWQRWQEQRQHDAEFAMRLNRLPELRQTWEGPRRLVIEQRPSPRGSVGTSRVRRQSNDTLSVCMVEVAGVGSVCGVMLANWIADGLMTILDAGADCSAGLNQMNQQLLPIFQNMASDAIASALVFKTLADTDMVQVACAGVPAPIHLQANQTQVWHGSGAFLGLSDSRYTQHAQTLPSSDRVVMFSGASTADRRPDLRAVADAHRDHPVAELLDVLVAELEKDTDPDSGWTIAILDKRL